MPQLVPLNLCHIELASLHFSPYMLLMPCGRTDPMADSPALNAASKPCRTLKEERKFLENFPSLKNILISANYHATKSSLNVKSWQLTLLFSFHFCCHHLSLFLGRWMFQADYRVNVHAKMKKKIATCVYTLFLLLTVTSLL